MRKLMWFTIGFVAACAVGAYLLLGSWLLVLGAVMLSGGIALVFLGSKPWKVVAVIVLGFAIGSVWNWCFQYYYLYDLRALDGQEKQIVVTATDYSYESDHGTVVDGTVKLFGKKFKVKLYLQDTVALEPGDTVKSVCSFRFTGYGAKDDPTYHQGKGIFLLAFAEGDVEIDKHAASSALRYFPVCLKRMVTQRIDQIFPEDVSSFARALLLGDTTKITYQEDTAFSISGIRHVIAVSGLHVSILFSVIYVLCFRKRFLTAMIGIPVLFLFAAVAGFTPSVVRACVMQGVLIFSMMVVEEYDSATALSLAVLVILGINPQTITDVSFQLSVACVIGIYAFSNPIHKYLISRPWAAGAAGKSIRSKLIRMAITSLSISFSVWAVTTPLCAIHFGMVSVVGAITNLLTVWLVSYIFSGIILACILSVIWLPAAIAAAWIVAWPMRLVQLIAQLLSKIPFAAVYTCSPYTVIWLVFCYVLLLAFVLLRFKRPGLLLSCMVVSLVISCGAGVLAERRIDSRMTVLDVGQGQCILLKDKGRYYMVDCGGDYDDDAADVAAEYLLSKGVYELEGIILTHYDADHTGGVFPLLSRIHVKNIYIPEIEPDNTVRKALVDAYPDKISIISGTRKIADEQITLFCGENRSSGNESGICVLFQPDNCDILILGDRGRAGELSLLQQTKLPQIDILVLGHHGAAGSTSWELLRQTRPTVAVISVGKNSFGHPADETLNRLAQIDCDVLRTDQDGTIEFGR